MSIALVVILVAVFIFKKPVMQKNNLKSSTNPSATVKTNSKIPTPPAVGEEFLTTLLNIKNIKLEDGIFSDPAFATLKDSTIELVSEGNEGRINPFAPIGVDPSTIVTNIPIIESTNTSSGTFTNIGDLLSPTIPPVGNTPGTH